MNSKENDVDDVVKQSTKSLDLLTYTQIPLRILKQINDFLNLKYCNNQNAINIYEQKEFEYIINLGLVQAKNELFSKKSLLLHNGKRPREDVWKKLGTIASEFLNCNTYPKIPCLQLPKVLNKALGNKDHRVIRDYSNTVLQYCNSDELGNYSTGSSFGELDVSFFVSLIPKQYIRTLSDTTTSTSFSQVEGKNR